MYEEWKRLYVEEHAALRRIARMFGVSDRTVARHLRKMGVELDPSTRIRVPLTVEKKIAMTEKRKGKLGYWQGKTMPKASLYKNMLNHIRWDVTLEFLAQFEDIERLKLLNSMVQHVLSRPGCRETFNTENYKRFILRFYDDENFIRQLAIYKQSGNKHDFPTLDHIIPLSRGGTNDLSNLQIISWFENHAKWDMTQDEYEIAKKKYWS